MDYDAVIVGAGPAGLLAARKIAAKGYSALVLEKDKDLGTRTCAEAVSISAFDTAEIPKMPSVISNNVEGAIVFPPDETKGIRVSGTTYKGYVLNKPLFLYALASKAAAAGAELKMRSEVKEILSEGGRASELVYEQKGEKNRVRFKVLIGSDGVGSLVARACAFNMEGYAIIPTMQYVMVNCDIPEQGMVRFYMGNEVAPLGYAWVFNKNESVANVGIGVRGKPAKVYLDKFVSNHPEFFKGAKIVKEGGGGVPVGGQVREVVKENVILCGDSAGQVIPITGGGIRTSMAAGSMAGAAAAEALETNDMGLLQSYPERYGEYWGARIQKSLRVLGAIDKLNDEELNLLSTLITDEDIVDLANGLNIKRVAAKLMKNPIVAMKIASKFL
jgi:digeranylgeranylglycerophospholipid reductase